MAANMEYALHKVESEGSSASLANPLFVNQASNAGASQQLHRKRSAECISTPKNQPFLSSYGSAFLSGIFADIADAASEDQPTASQDASHDPTAHDSVCSHEPSPKKARTTASTSFGRQPKSYTALAGLAEGACSEALSPSVVSPRPNTSTLKIQLFNDQVRELQDMAFPSLPQIPITVSSSSCSSASREVVTPRDADVSMESGDGNMGDEQDGSSYGWFVSTDDDVADAAEQNETSAASMFLPDTKPDLAFQAFSAPSAGDQDLEVQQALAADTIDDVLGDLF